MAKRNKPTLFQLLGALSYASEAAKIRKIKEAEASQKQTERKRKAKERAVKLKLAIIKEKQLVRKRELEIKLLQKELEDPAPKTKYGKGLPEFKDVYFDKCEKCDTLYPGHMKQIRCQCGGELHSEIINPKELFR